MDQTRAQLKQFLSKLDLSEKEAQLYLASLEYGAQPASTLALRTGLPRSTVNFLFKELVQKGFANRVTQNGTNVYSVIQPESLQYIIDEKKASVRKMEHDLENAIPFLKGLQKQSSQISKVRFYVGLEGVLRAIDESCEEDLTSTFISSHNNMDPRVRDYIESTYLPKARAQKNKNRMILNRGKSAQAYLEKAKGAYSEVRLLDAKDYAFKLTTAVQGEKVFLISYDPEDLSAIIIENRLIAQHMLSIYAALSELAAYDKSQ